MEENNVVEDTDANREGDDDYVNLNPKATPDEVRLGTFLHRRALAGDLPGVRTVAGAPEVPGQRSGDYRFVLHDGRVVSVDLYQPESTNTRSIAMHIMQKSGQAMVIVIELGRRRSGHIGDEEATHMVQEILATPGHTINRIMVIRDEMIIVDTSQAI